MAEPNLHPNLSEPYDAADPEQVRKRDREAKRREKATREVLATLLQTPAGRNWIWDLMTKTHIFQTSFSSDAMTTAFREGERNIGLMIVAQINSFHPDALVQVMREKGDA